MIFTNIFSLSIFFKRPFSSLPLPVLNISLEVSSEKRSSVEINREENWFALNP